MQRRSFLAGAAGPVRLPYGQWYTIKYDAPDTETAGVAGGLKYQDDGSGTVFQQTPPLVTNWQAVYWFAGMPNTKVQSGLVSGARSSADQFHVFAEFEIGAISKAAGIWVGTVTKVDLSLGVTWNNLTRSTEYDPVNMRVLHSDPAHVSAAIRYMYLAAQTNVTTTSFFGLYFALRPARNGDGDSWEHKGQLMTCTGVTRVDA
jgi:hypothetical protein